MGFIQQLAKQAAKMVGSAISHVRPGTDHARRLLASPASNRQSAWHYGSKKRTAQGDADVGRPTGPGDAARTEPT